MAYGNAREKGFLMNNQNAVAALAHVVQSWQQTLGEVVSWEPVKDNVLRIKAGSGNTFILKAVPRRPSSTQHLHAQLSLLHHLQQCNVPVAVPILTDERHSFVEQEERIYLLLPELPQGGRCVR